MEAPPPGSWLKAWAGNIMVRSSDWMDEHRRQVASSALLTVAVCTGLLLHLNGLPGYTRCTSLSQAAAWLQQRQRRTPLQRALLPGGDQLRLPVRVVHAAVQGGLLCIHVVHHPLLLRLRHVFSGTQPSTFMQRAAAAGETLPVHLLGVAGCSEASAQLLLQHLPGTMARFHLTCISHHSTLVDASLPAPTAATLPAPPLAPPPPAAAAAASATPTPSSSAAGVIGARWQPLVSATCGLTAPPEESTAATPAGAAAVSGAGKGCQVSLDPSGLTPQQHSASCCSQQTACQATSVQEDSTTSSRNGSRGDNGDTAQQQQVAWGVLYMQRCSRAQLKQAAAAAAAQAVAARQGGGPGGTSSRSRLAAALQLVKSLLMSSSSSRRSSGSSSRSNSNGSSDTSSKSSSNRPSSSTSTSSSRSGSSDAASSSSSNSDGSRRICNAWGGVPNPGRPVWAAVTPAVDAAQLLLAQGLGRCMEVEDCDWLGLPAQKVLHYGRAEAMARRKGRGLWQVY